MTEVKRILFATDGSEFSEGAQRLAITLARRCGARLWAMTIVLNGSDLEGVGTRNLRETQEREAQARLRLVVEAAAAEGLACTSEVAFGDAPDHEIVGTAHEVGADLVVLGRRGKRGLARFMVGHATGQVAAKAPCDVLVVPRSAGMWSRRVLVATDGSEVGDAAVAAAGRVGLQCGLPVSVVSATMTSHSAQRKAEAKDAVDRAVAALAQAGIDCEGMVLEGRPDAVIVQAAQDRSADLVVIGSHGRTRLSRLFLGSISERVIGQAVCPVLVAHAAE